MSFFETDAYAHPADEVYEGQPAVIGEVEKNPHTHITGSLWGTLITVLPVIIVLALVYFVLIRPQRKSDRAMKKIRDSIEIGDEIETIGGICGTAADVDEKYVYLEFEDVNGENAALIKIKREAVEKVIKTD